MTSVFFKRILSAGAAIGLLSCCTIAFAQAEEKSPLEITADQALEWNQKDKTYIARGKALASQGKMSVSADLLTARYAGEKNSTSDLTEISAEGHVLMMSGTDTATGDKAVYDLQVETIDLSGSRPKITKGKDTLEADHIKVFLENGALVRAEADGKVVIVTAGTQQASGDKAVYIKSTDTADLTGNVRLMQGENWIEGEHAQMNLTTKISRMTGEKGAGEKNAKRVKGVFYPATKKE